MSFKVFLSDCRKTANISTPPAKMGGIACISTSTTNNAFCNALRNSCNSLDLVCKHCFAYEGLSYKGDSVNEFFTNNDFMKCEILSLRDCMTIAQAIKYNCLTLVRFESHGELETTIQVLNYFNIARCCSEIGLHSALWFKNKFIFLQAIKKYDIKKPEGFYIVQSSLFKNIPCEKCHPYVDKIFTVYDEIYLINKFMLTPSEVYNFINCDAKKCFNCKLCYSKNETVYINEILKHDSSFIKEWASCEPVTYKVTYKSKNGMCDISEGYVLVELRLNHKKARHRKKIVNYVFNKFIFSQNDNLDINYFSFRVIKQ